MASASSALTRRVLVTGGGGVIGVRLVATLQAAGAAVTVLDTQRTPGKPPLPAATTVVRGSCVDEVAVAEAMATADIVFHLAACNAYESTRHPHLAFRDDVAATASVLAAAAARRRPPRVVFASSCKVRGSSQDGDGAGLADSPPVMAKAFGERMCRFYARHHGVETLALRYFTVYGPGQAATDDGPFVPKVLRSLLRGEPIDLAGDGTATRDFVFVDDVVAATVAAASVASAVCDGRAVDVGTGVATPIGSFVALAGRLLGIAPRVRSVSMRPFDAGYDPADVATTREILGVVPSTALDDGLGRTIDWLAATPQPA